jgi:hypothetical protein
MGTSFEDWKAPEVAALYLQTVEDLMTRDADEERLREMDRRRAAGEEFKVKFVRHGGRLTLDYGTKDTTE